jgi:hypothetical protein
MSTIEQGVTDYFSGGEVVVEFAPPVFPSHPVRMKISVSHVTKQEGLPSDPNPHFILMLSLWFPRVQLKGSWVSVALLTDDVPAQKYGEALLLGTPVHLINYPVRNFYVFPRSDNKIDILHFPGLVADWRGSQGINLPLNRLPHLPPYPTHPYYTETDQSFMLPPFTLKFTGYGEKFPETLTIRMPVGRDYTMTQTTTSQAAHVDFTCQRWLIGTLLRFEGKLFSGKRVFTFPPSEVDIPKLPDHW